MDKSCLRRSWQSTNHSWSPSVAETLVVRKVLLAFKDKWSRDSQRFNNSVWVFWNITYREILGVIKRHSRLIYPHCELISAASVWQQNAVMEDKRTRTLTQSLLFYLPEQTREHSLRHHDFVNKSNGDQWNFSSFWKWFSQGFFN